MLQRSSRNFLLLALVAGFIHAAPVNAQGVRIEPVTDPAVNSPKEEVRRKLFENKPDQAGCVAVRADPKGVSGVDGTLDTFLKEVVLAMKARDEMRFQPLFHPRMNVSLPALSETFAKLANVYGLKADVSLLRLWALNTVDGTPADLTCEADQLALRALYGYPLQFAVWLQVMGDKELGRIYLSIVPADGKWNLGAFHAQQWTHDGKDFQAWAAEAEKAAKLGFAEAAYIDYDMAAKLLDGGNYVDLAVRKDVVKARDAVMTPEVWSQSVSAAVKDFDVIYTSTLLVLDGAGILLRVKIPEEISVERMKSQCRQMAQKLLLKPWSAAVTGIRCNFNLPKEDPKVDGALGGLYLAFSELRSGKGK